MIPEIEILKKTAKPLGNGFFLLSGKIVAKPFICRKCSRIHVAYGTSKRHARKNMKAIEERCRQLLYTE